MKITKTNREYLSTTNRSVYNKHQLRELDCWSRRERNRRRREEYYKQERDIYTHYGYNLIEKCEVSREVAMSYIHQENYGVVWEWRKKYKQTVYHDKRPSWKLANKCKKQWQTSKLKFDSYPRYNLKRYKW